MEEKTNLNMMAHSFSADCQGFLPVANSSVMQPTDQMSMAPSCPPGVFLMTSGDMYMGVPFIEPIPAVRVRLIVLCPRAMTLAAPKSTSLMMPASDVKRTSEKSEKATKGMSERIERRGRGAANALSGLMSR